MKLVIKTAIALGLSAALIGCNQQQSDEPDSTEVEAEADAADAADAEEASDAPTEPVAFDIAEITCWDFSTTDDEEQAFAATLLYGYSAGAAGTSAQTSDGIEQAIVSAVEFCVENPDAMALDAFKSDAG